MKKAVKILLWTAFILYCLILLYILFLSRAPMIWYSVPEFFIRFTNLTPLKTIFEYINRYSEGFKTLSVRNLGINLFLLAPIGFLLPCLFKKLRRFWKVTVTILITTILAELLQGILRVGSVDIDDVIFNVLGGMLGYGIYKLPFINKALHRIF